MFYDQRTLGDDQTGLTDEQQTKMYGPEVYAPDGTVYRTKNQAVFDARVQYDVCTAQAAEKRAQELLACSGSVFPLNGLGRGPGPRPGPRPHHGGGRPWGVRPYYGGSTYIQVGHDPHACRVAVLRKYRDYTSRCILKAKADAQAAGELSGLGFFGALGAKKAKKVPRPIILPLGGPQNYFEQNFPVTARCLQTKKATFPIKQKTPEAQRKYVENRIYAQCPGFPTKVSRDFKARYYFWAQGAKIGQAGVKPDLGVPAGLLPVPIPAPAPTPYPVAPQQPYYPQPAPENYFERSYPAFAACLKARAAGAVATCTLPPGVPLQFAQAYLAWARGMLNKEQFCQTRAPSPAYPGGPVPAVLQWACPPKPDMTAPPLTLGPEPVPGLPYMPPSSAPVPYMPPVPAPFPPPSAPGGMYAPAQWGVEEVGGDTGEGVESQVEQSLVSMTPSAIAPTMAIPYGSRGFEPFAEQVQPGGTCSIEEAMSATEDQYGPLTPVQVVCAQAGAGAQTIQAGPYQFQSSASVEAGEMQAASAAEEGVSGMGRHLG